MGQLVEASKDTGLGGIPRRTLVERMVTRKETLLAVMRQLGHPYVPAYENATCDVLEEQVLLVATLHAKTWPGISRPEPVDIALSAVLKAGLEDSVVRSVFGGVSSESELTAPVSARLKSNGLTVEAEVPAGGSCADLVGYNKGLFGRKIVAVELKNEVRECERLVEQLADYGRRADSVCVVMTPECLARVTLAREELANPTAYHDFIKKQRAELWVYDAKADTFQRVSAECTASYDEDDYTAFWECLEARKAAA